MCVLMRMMLKNLMILTSALVCVCVEVTRSMPEEGLRIAEEEEVEEEEEEEKEK